MRNIPGQTDRRDAAVLIVIALLLAVLVLQGCMAISKLSRIITMSENVDTELSEIDAKIVTLSNAVQFAGNTFVDLAQKLAAAIAGSKQIGLTDAQLAEFTNIKGQLDGAASELTLAATTADPAPPPAPAPAPAADTPPAAAGADTISGGQGPDTVTSPTGSDTTSG